MSSKQNAVFVPYLTANLLKLIKRITRALVVYPNACIPHDTLVNLMNLDFHGIDGISKVFEGAMRTSTSPFMISGRKTPPTAKYYMIVFYKKYQKNAVLLFVQILRKKSRRYE